MPTISAANFAALFILVQALFAITQADECELTQVIHKVQYPGCEDKIIGSYACVGRCTSYVKVSGSKIWQTERSCMCCQESGEKLAVVSLECPNSASSQPKVRKMVTRAPAGCMCRPCTAIDEESIMPSEFVGYSNAHDLRKNFLKGQN